VSPVSVTCPLSRFKISNNTATQVRGRRGHRVSPAASAKFPPFAAEPNRLAAVAIPVANEIKRYG
jgi:hypothetical protein